MNIPVEERLGHVSFEISKESHIVVDTNACRECREKPCLVFCPAGRYTLEKGDIKHDYEGCLECASCKFACPKDAIEFDYPGGGFGVYYRYG